MHERVYHANSLDLMIWFDPAGISALDHCHGNADEKEHLPLLHATTEEDKGFILKTSGKTTGLSCSMIHTQ